MRATVAILAATVLGFALGRFTAPHESAPAPADVLARETSSEFDLAPTPPFGDSIGHSALSETESARSLVDRWRYWSAEPNSPRRDDELERALDDLAGVDPARARSLADAETHVWRRQRLVSAAARGWARANAASAIDWVLQQPAGEREELLRAAFAGAAARPDELITVVESLLASEPVYARERGAAAIDALVGAGAFDAAAQFAGAGLAEYRDSWLAAAYARWAEHQPESAVIAAVELREEGARRAAINAVVKGWAQTEPATLAEFARHMPADTTRTYALGEALRQWIELDPVGASSWIDQWPASPELDDAVAAIAQQPYLATVQPEVAVSWAESISDPNVRGATLLAITQAWATVDPQAAYRYLDQLSDISEEQRKDLLGLLHATP